MLRPDVPLRAEAAWSMAPGSIISNRTRSSNFDPIVSAARDVRAARPNLRLGLARAAWTACRP